MSAPPASTRRRRARTILTAPRSHDAGQLVLDAHLKRLMDRQRHALARMTDEIQVIRRFQFDGVRMEPSHKPEDCWWFREAASAGSTTGAVMRQGSVLGRGPPTGTRRWCYYFSVEPIARVVKLDWQEITTVMVAAIFDAWEHESALKQTAGLGECMRECAPRRKAVREVVEPVLLHVWSLRLLIDEHVHRHCQAANAWQLAYKESGLVQVPPLRITARDLFPVTEHEAQVLQRRPHFANLLYREFMQQQYPPAVPAAAAAAAEQEEQEEQDEQKEEQAAEPAPAVTKPATAAPVPVYGMPGVVRPFRDDRNFLSSVTPDYNDSEDDDEGEEVTMDTSA